MIMDEVDDHLKAKVGPLRISSPPAKALDGADRPEVQIHHHCRCGAGPCRAPSGTSPTCRAMSP